jgi:hypothetical protein
MAAGDASLRDKLASKFKIKNGLCQRSLPGTKAFVIDGGDDGGPSRRR